MLCKFSILNVLITYKYTNKYPFVFAVSVFFLLLYSSPFFLPSSLSYLISYTYSILNSDHSLYIWPHLVLPFSPSSLSFLLVFLHSTIFLVLFFYNVSFISYFKGTVQRDFRLPVFSSFKPAWATDQWV